MDSEKLKAGNSRLTKVSDTSSNIAGAGAYRKPLWNADKLTTENAYMQAELDQLLRTLAQATVSPFVN